MNNITAAYRCHIKIVKRSEGKNVVNSAAYISRAKINDKQIGKTFNYEKGYSEILYSKIHAPEIALNWVTDRETLWNKVEAMENRKDAQLGRMLELNLPHQLSTAQMIETLESFVKDNFISEGMIADINLHSPDESGDKRNIHAHILLTMRKATEGGFEKKKTRDWNKTEFVLKWREKWALICSHALDEAGFELDARRWEFGNLDFKEQLKKAIERDDKIYIDICNREVTKHKGAAICGLEKKGILSYVKQDREAEAHAIKFITEQNLERLEKELELLEKAEQDILIRLEKEKLPSIQDIIEKRKQHQHSHDLRLELRR